jgi:predicted nucleic acid-binding protein
VTGYVLDASVAAKWFLPAGGEPLREEALALLERFAAGRTALRVPGLFWAEFGNILWKACRQERMTRKAAEEAIAALRGVRIATTPSADLLAESFALAAATGRTVYDCMYVALAVGSGSPLITADEKLANALAARFPVRWLGAAVTP